MRQHIRHICSYQALPNQPTQRIDINSSVPHYHVVSRRITGFFGAPVLNWFRTVLIEDIYRSICKTAGFWKANVPLTFIIAYMFPETANWLASAEEYVPSSHTCISLY